MSNSHFKVDSSLRLNVAIAFALLIICPLALWQFHFRMNGETPKEITPQELVANYYRAYNRNNFNAVEFYAANVNQYDSLVDISADSVLTLIAESRKTNLFPHVTIHSEGKITTKDEEGHQVATVVITTVNYCKPLMKYASMDETVSFTFNDQNKIIGVISNERAAPIYSFSRPK